jgi:hypothetical protein
MSTRFDAVDESYSPIRVAGGASSVLFAASTALSILVLLLPSGIWSDIAQVSFAVAVFAAFVLSIALRQYWGPRAHRKRIDDLISHAFNVQLIDKSSSGYYHTKETAAARRLNAAVAENTFYGKAIVTKMLPGERVFFFGYVLVWIVAVMFRSTSLTMLIVVSQALFSEQIFSRWIRIEALRLRFENIYDSARNLSKFNKDKDLFLPLAIQNFVQYELAKAHAGVSLSTRIFDELNKQLEVEWAEIEKEL